MLVTFSVPPFDFRSPWWWGFSNLEGIGPWDIVGPSDVHQFKRKQGTAGMAHFLNVYADPETEWTERERVEFAVKSYVYLSKQHRKIPYDRIVVADCAGIEPLLVGELSVMAPVWVREPGETRSASDRGATGYGMMNQAERTFELSEFTDEPDRLTDWPPAEPVWLKVFAELLGGA